MRRFSPFAHIAAVLALALSLCAGLAMTATAQTPGQHQVITRPSDKGEVKLDVTIRGRGPLVILIPSLGRGAADFDDLATRIATSGFTTAAIDPRGIGASTGPMDGLTMTDYADDVAAVAAKLAPGKAVILVGHAFGNRVARATAAHHPEVVSRLILLAAGGQAPPTADVAKALSDVFDESLSPADHIAAVAKAFFAPGADPEVWRGGWNTAAMRSQRAALTATGPDTWTGGGSAPILIIQAANDAVAPPANAEALAKAYPDRVSVNVLPRAGHAMLPEQPLVIAILVISYLKQSANG